MISWLSSSVTDVQCVTFGVACSSTIVVVVVVLEIYYLRLLLSFSIMIKIWGNDQKNGYYY